MKSDIKNIQIVYKYGAYGNTTKYAMWIYGKRPDGRTVPCKNKSTEDGGIKIYSRSYETEFSSNEWKRILYADISSRILLCNEILMKREN